MNGFAMAVCVNQLRLFSVVFFCMSNCAVATAISVQIGETNYEDGNAVEPRYFLSTEFGDPIQLSQNFGVDGRSGRDFSAEWSFRFDAMDYIAATVTLGIFDHDSQAAGSQLDYFGFDDNDLTDLLNVEFESYGGRQGEYNVYSVGIPAYALKELADGNTEFRIALQGPSLSGDALTVGKYFFLSQEGNAAGIDYVLLTLSTIPEPDTLHLAMLASVVFHRSRRSVRLSRRKHRPTDETG